MGKSRSVFLRPWGAALPLFRSAPSWRSLKGNQQASQKSPLCNLLSFYLRKILPGCAHPVLHQLLWLPSPGAAGLSRSCALLQWASSILASMWVNRHPGLHGEERASVCPCRCQGVCVWAGRGGSAHMSTVCCTAYPGDLLTPTIHTGQSVWATLIQGFAQKGGSERRDNGFPMSTFSRAVCLLAVV